MPFYQNGLFLPNPRDLAVNTAPYIGVTVCKWLYEWLRYVVGRPIIDEPVGTKWNSSVAEEWTTGTGQSVAGEPDQFDIGSSTYNFQADDEEQGYLTISGLTPSTRDGVYRIRKVLSNKVVILYTRESVHEDGIPAGMSGIKWRLWRNTTTYTPDRLDSFVFSGTGLTNAGYTYHVHLWPTDNSSASDLPRFEMGPYGNWDNVGHAWSDSRHTAAWGPNYNEILKYQWSHCWAHADETSLTFFLHIDMREWSSRNLHVFYYHIGELNPFYPSQDPRPVIGLTGETYTYEDSYQLFGYGKSSRSSYEGRMLGYDDLTTLTQYFMFLHSPTSYNDNWIGWYRAKFSQYSGKMYRFPIIAESRTTGYQEIRGPLRNLWFTARATKPMLPYGTNREYLHLVGGLSIPWHGSRNHIINVPTSV